MTVWAFRPWRTVQGYGKKLEAAGASVEINETAGTFHGYDIAIKSKVARMNIEKRFTFLKRAFG